MEESVTRRHKAERIIEALRRGASAPPGRSRTSSTGNTPVDFVEQILLRHELDTLKELMNG